MTFEWYYQWYYDMSLRKCVLLLPLAYNDGTEVSPSVLAEILKGLDGPFRSEIDHSIIHPVEEFNPFPLKILFHDLSTHPVQQSPYMTAIVEEKWEVQNQKAGNQTRHQGQETLAISTAPVRFTSNWELR
jgi:hypothetical protein